MCDHGDFASAADQFSHLVSGRAAAATLSVVAVVAECRFNPLSNAMTGCPHGSLLQQGNGSFAVESGKADSRRVVGDAVASMRIWRSTMVSLSAFKRDPH
jgi:hypothetical protein